MDLILYHVSVPGCNRVEAMSGVWPHNNLQNFKFKIEQHFDFKNIDFLFQKNYH